MPDTPVIELLRVSTEAQAERLGLPAQRHTNRQTCERFGLKVVETVQIVMSGAEVAETPEMERLLSIVETGRAVGIVVAAYDRLFRPEKWSDMLVLQRLHDANASIYTPSGEIDLNTEMGHAMATLQNLFAAMERRRIRQRLEDGREEKRRRGHHVGFKCSIPKGLDWSESEGWTYTPEIELVRHVFRRFLGGEHSYTALGEETGLPRTTVRYVLTNEVYTGYRVYDERRDTTAQGKLPCGDHRKRKRRKENIIRVRLRDSSGTPLEPIVSVEAFAQVQRVVEAHRASSARARARTEGAYVYRGTLFCTCGELCYCYNAGRYKNGKPKRFYHCRTRAARYGPPCGSRYMSVGRLEDVLDRRLSRVLSSKRILKRAIRRHDEQLALSHEIAGHTAPDRKAIRRHISALEDRRRRVIDTFIDGHITKAERDRRMSALEAEAGRYAFLEETTAPVRPTMVGQATSRASAEDIIAGIVDIFADWRRLAFSEKEDILSVLSPRIIVANYEPHGIYIDTERVDLAGSNMVSPSRKVDSVTTSAKHFACDKQSGLYIPLSVAA